MELVDIFDDNNNFTGQIVERREAYNKKLNVRTVSCWILNEKGEVLMQRRSKNKPRNPNRWAKTGGQVGSGEKVEEAIYREVKEEIGIEIPREEIKIQSVKKIDSRFTYNFIFFVNYKIEDYIIQKEELSEVKYMTIEYLENAQREHNNNFTFVNWKLGSFEEEIKNLKENRLKLLEGKVHIIGKK